MNGREREKNRGRAGKEELKEKELKERDTEVSKKEKLEERRGAEVD